MTVKSTLRGHDIEHDGEHWVYSDTKEPTATTWKDRACGHCGQLETDKGHDACIPNLPGVKNACYCGHGDVGYVQFENGITIRGYFDHVKEEGSE